MPQPRPEPPAPSAAAAAAGATQIVGRLKELEAQREAGTLTQAEFDRERRALLTEPPR